MVAPVPPGAWQFIDADGRPYAGGTIGTYVVGTTTPKNTWADHLAAALNPNPIVLDAAGRCTMFGDGEFRLMLRDQAGNLVYDQYATTLVSAAMQPVIVAPDLATARRLMGIDDAIAAAVLVETNRALAAEAALQAAINAAISSLTALIEAETARAEAKETELQNNLAQERAERIAADDAINGRIGAGGGIRAGTGLSDSNGNIVITFDPSFTSACTFFVVTIPGTTLPNVAWSAETWVGEVSYPSDGLSRIGFIGSIVSTSTVTAPGEGGGTTIVRTPCANATYYWSAIGT